MIAKFNVAVFEFLDKREGNIEDAYEIVLSRVSERAFMKIAKEKYGLSDELLK